MRFGAKSKKGLGVVVANEEPPNRQLSISSNGSGSNSPDSNGSGRSGSNSPTDSIHTTKATNMTKVKVKPRITTTTQTFRANGSEVVHHLAEISDVEDEAASAGGASADDNSSTKGTTNMHMLQVSDVDDDVDGGETTDAGTDADIKSTSSSDESSIYSTEDEDEDEDDEEGGATSATAKADNCDKYANADSSDDEDESKAESLEVTSKENLTSTEGVKDETIADGYDGASAAPEEPIEEDNKIEKKENKMDKDDVSLTAKPDKLATSSHHGDSTESTVATQDDEASQASDVSECEDTTLERTPWVKINPVTETVTPVEAKNKTESGAPQPEQESATAESTAATAAADVLARNELLQQYRDQAASKSIPQLIRQDLMSHSAHTIQIRAALDELAARASPAKHDLDDEYGDYKARRDQVNKNRDTIARTGGLLAVVQNMERLTDHADIQVSACRALEKLALDGENETAIADVGGVEAILAAMMANFKNESLHEAAWGALMNLSCRNADSVMTVDTAGGMEAIIAAMQYHVTNADIQRNACGTLANLCISNETRRAALAKAGGFVAIAAALQRHWNDSDVKDEASSTLTALLEEPARQYDSHLDRA